MPFTGILLLLLQMDLWWHCIGMPESPYAVYLHSAASVADGPMMTLHRHAREPICSLPAFCCFRFPPSACMHACLCTCNAHDSMNASCACMGMRDWWVCVYVLHAEYACPCVHVHVHVVHACMWAYAHERMHACMHACAHTLLYSFRFSLLFFFPYQLIQPRLLYLFIYLFIYWLLHFIQFHPKKTKRKKKKTK
jgi:hypothetical protein